MLAPCSGKVHWKDLFGEARALTRGPLPGLRVEDLKWQHLQLTLFQRFLPPVLLSLPSTLANANHPLMFSHKIQLPICLFIPYT